MTRFERMILENCKECYSRRCYYEGRDASIKTYKFVGTNSVEIVDSEGFVYIYDGFEDRLYPMMNPEDIITEEDILQDFSIRFKYFKEESKRTFNDISIVTGIGISTLKKYASGSLTPSMISLLKIAKCLHCRIEDLTGF